MTQKVVRKLKHQEQLVVDIFSYNKTSTIYLLIEGFSEKKALGFFTENWKFSHAVLFRCVKQCSVCFLAEVCFVFKILRNYAKILYLLSRQHVPAKTVISLKIQQNIDLLHVTLKNVDFS